MTDTQTPAPPVNSYDEFPYESHPFAQTNPDRLATVATLFGLRPAPLQRCRVLELGCAAGGNLLPMAEQLPDARFLGIDLSARQVADGQQAVRQLGLTNVEIRHASILDVDDGYGKFDYLVCHGVFSWVPPAVQGKILEIARDRLNPGGVAYVSYNTNPGWHMRGMIRGMMRYHAENFATPRIRTRQARALLDFLAGSVGETSPYATLLKQEVETLRHQADSYLYHEHLEEVNEPLFFHQFMQRAHARGLQYLGEARVGTMVMSNFQPEVEKTLRMLATDQIQAEQYMDFLRNRMFRETLLVHQGVTAQWSVQTEALRRLLVASRAVPEKDPALAGGNESVTFRTPGGMALATAQPVLKAALLSLRECWPQAVPFDRLLELVRTRLGGADTPRPPAAEDQLLLGRGLLDGYFGSDLVEFRVTPVPCVTSVGERPVASPIARLQASRGPLVTNRRHEVVRLNDLERRLLPLLDGRRDRQALLDELTDAAAQGNLSVQREEETLQDPAAVRAALDAILSPCLAGVARNALLAG